jgi:phage shock protein A
MEDRSAAKKIGDLQNQLRSKESKMTQLRQAVVRLKQAFMESEEVSRPHENERSEGARGG